MRFRLEYKRRPAREREDRGKRGYTFVEVLFGMGILGFVATSLCVGFNAGFCLIKSTREDLRASQIMVQKLEAIRLFTWSQVGNTNNYLKSTFTEAYDPQGAAKGSGGPEYKGQITVTIPAAGTLPEAYRTNLRDVTVNVSWTTHNGDKAIPHQREMQTRVARNGMQNYIWGAL